MASPRDTVLGLLLAATAACASSDEVTPMIAISPGAKERILMMDRLRHHGSPRRILPSVTVEEIDESELPATSDDANEPNASEAPDASDAPPATDAPASEAPSASEAPDASDAPPATETGRALVP